MFERPFGHGFTDRTAARSSVERQFGRLKDGYGVAFLRVRGIERVRLHADLTMLARLSQRSRRRESAARRLTALPGAFGLVKGVPNVPRVALQGLEALFERRLLASVITVTAFARTSAAFPPFIRVVDFLFGDGRPVALASLIATTLRRN